MTKEVWFWVIFVLSALFGGFSVWKGTPENRLDRYNPLIIYVLIFLLGLGVYGSPLK
jgi:hypothetical protein